MNQINKLREEYKHCENQLFEQRKNYKQMEPEFLALADVEKTFTDQIKKLNEKYEAILEKLKVSE